MEHEDHDWAARQRVLRQALERRSLLLDHTRILRIRGVAVTGFHGGDLSSGHRMRPSLFDTGGLYVSEVAVRPAAGDLSSLSGHYEIVTLPAQPQEPTAQAMLGSPESQQLQRQRPLSTVRRSYADIVHLFAYLPETYRVPSASSSSTGGSDQLSSCGIPPLPPDPVLFLRGGNGTDDLQQRLRDNTAQMGRCLDTLRRTLQIEAVLQCQHHARAIDPADFRRVLAAFEQTVGLKR